MASLPPSTKQWSDSSILRTIPNPAKHLNYVTIIENPEVTFLGARDQPDFAILTIEYIAEDTVIELKALKQYLYYFRDKLISYERFLSVVYEDLLKVYSPRMLKLTAVFNARGGMKSTLIISFPISKD